MIYLTETIIPSKRKEVKTFLPLMSKKKVQTRRPGHSKGYKENFDPLSIPQLPDLFH